MPIHFYAQYQEYESKFEFIFEGGILKGVKIKKVNGRLPLPENKLRQAEIFIKKYHAEIAEKWTEFFILKKKIKSEKITKKIK